MSIRKAEGNREQRTGNSKSRTPIPHLCAGRILFALFKAHDRSGKENRKKR
jgi:hypothetical protein